MCWVPKQVHAALYEHQQGVEHECTRANVHDGTGIPKRVVERGHGCAVRRVGDLSDKHGCGICRECETEADHKTSTDEHVDAGGGSLQNDGANHDERAGEDRHAASDAVRKEGSEGVSRERANVLNGVQETELGARRIAEVRVPLLERLRQR
jgi:hypothetical protein